ncbi:GyrI-like domain-containing protein [Dietzia sp. PP-33]|uniref:GyrI-like domain-containing protein n=1 Tax=Dietzia sp. PP-33 TaxID=2957500 RepID=UPI0029AA0262|nr:GyrI-like domain-containing protein [Dietzia sp. PP-33]MDX2358906.1 GyrI-like domain-containing protein [Dietzia sp. PP-33]
MTDLANLAPARDQALEIRRLYETLEQRFNGKTWSLHELMLGFSNDVGYIGRLLLANDGTWAIDGDSEAELKHKLAESLWWVFVLAERLEIDIDQAFADTMATIRTGLNDTIARTEPMTAAPHLHAPDDPELVRVPAMTYASIAGSGSPGTDEFYRKMALIGDIARQVTRESSPVIEIQYWYPEGSTPVEIADFYSVNPVPSLLYRIMAAVPDATTTEDLAAARARAESEADRRDDVIELHSTPEQDVVQIMHHGPFAEEFPTLERLGALAQQRGTHRSGPHHEIHLDGFTRETPQDTLRTILRDPVS